MNFNAFRQFHELIRRGFVPQTDEPIRPREVHLLTLLNIRPGMPLFFYAEQVHLERGSFTYLTDNLEIRGLIKRQSDPRDKRRKTIVLTAKGRDLVLELKRQMDEYMEVVLSVYNEEEMQELNDALDTVKRLLKKLPRPNHHKPPQNDPTHREH